MHEAPSELTVSKDMKDAFTVLERGTWSVTELNKYQAFFDASIAEKMVLETAKEEGEKKGKLEGKLEVARTMLFIKKMNIEDIAEITGLTIQEVENVKKKD